MMRPLQRLDTFGVQSSGTVAHDTEKYLDDRLKELLQHLPADPALEVAATPRGDYVEVMIFVGRDDVKAEVEARTQNLHDELREFGVPTIFYVRTWTP